MRGYKKTAPSKSFWERLRNRIKRHSVDFWLSVTALLLSILAFLLKVFAR